MKLVRKVIFVGDDLDYLNEGQTFFHKLSSSSTSYQFSHITPQADLSFYSLLKNKDCLLVILDFTHQDADQRSWLEQIRTLKSHQFLKQVVFVGLYKNKKDLDESQDALHFGLNYFHVKGNDIPQLFKDITYVAYEVLYHPESYARVKNIALPYLISMPAFISRINTDGIKINCDFEADGNELNVRYSFLGTVRNDVFEIDQSYEGAEVGNNLNSYDLSFRYPGAWEEKTEDSLSREAVRQWFEEYPGLTIPTRKFLIWTEQEDLYETIKDYPAPQGYELIIDQVSIRKKLSTGKPEVLMIDLSKENAENYKSFFWDFLLDYDRGSDEPFLIIFNSPVSTETFKVEFNYQKVLCHEQICNFETLDLLLKMYAMRNKSSSNELDYKSFHVTDVNAYVEVKVPVVVTSLTEHEITFYHDKELAMYSILKIDVPTECYVLIVPPFWKLEARENRFHHMALIMGLDHEESMYIRTFVNQAIFNPLKSFEKRPLLPPKAEAAKKEEEIAPEIVPVKEEAELVRKKSYKRSKL